MRAVTTYRHAFTAMNSPCEFIAECDDPTYMNRLGAIVESEARRIETKFSRYLKDSVISTINAAKGKPVEVDLETLALLRYSGHCWEISNGLFDVTSGVLRQAWSFDGTRQLPATKVTKQLVKNVGWQKISISDTAITLPAGMEIDFGGVAKEYAVDSAMNRVRAVTQAPCLINFGGDLRVSGPRDHQQPWRIQLESVDNTRPQEGYLDIKSGALTTSGDAKRLIIHNGVRYSHILNPRTGRPVKNPPRSITVAAETCLQAGILSTLAMLHGSKAEQFLRNEEITAWVVR